MEVRKQLAGAAVGVAVVLGTVPPASAHPHVWIDARTEVIFDERQRVKALRLFWRFDEFYSLFSIEGLDKNGDGRVDAEELRPLAEVNITSLKDYRYFTYVTVAGEDVPYGPVTDYRSAYDDGILSLEFVIPLETPMDPVVSELRFVSYDPTFYIAIEPALEAPVGLRDAPPHCRAVEIKPESAETLQLSEADFLDPAASAEVGRLYATEFVITCGPAEAIQ